MGQEKILKQMEEALQREYDLYNLLQDLSLQQQEALSAAKPDVDHVADLMNRKMEVLNSIKQLEQEHLEIKAEWEQEYQNYSQTQREVVAARKNSLLNLIEEIYNLEGIIANGMKKCGNQIHEKIHNLNKGKQVNRSYLNFETGPPRFIDKKR